MKTKFSKNSGSRSSQVWQILSNTAQNFRKTPVHAVHKCGRSYLILPSPSIRLIKKLYKDSLCIEIFIAIDFFRIQKLYKYSFCIEVFVAVDFSLQHWPFVLRKHVKR
jgi:uncharacterized protein YqiB (DUF1249 family)